MGRERQKCRSLESCCSVVGPVQKCNATRQIVCSRTSHKMRGGGGDVAVVLRSSFRAKQSVVVYRRSKTEGEEGEWVEVTNRIVLE